MPLLPLTKPWGRFKPPLGVQADPAAVSSLGLTGAWLLNEGAGNQIYDLSPNNFTATLTTPPSWSADPIGSALLFDSAQSQFVSLNSSSILAPAILSFACWVFADRRQLSLATSFDVVGDGVSGGKRLEVTWRSDVGNRIDISWNSGIVAAATGIGVTYGVLQHFAVTKAGVNGNWTVKIYLNGIPVSTTTAIATNQAGTGTATLGQSGVPGNFWLGTLNMPMFGNVAWTDDQVAHLFTEPYWWVKPQKRPVAYSLGGSAPVVTTSPPLSVGPDMIGQLFQWEEIC